MRIRRLSAGALISLLVVSLASRGGTAELPLVADELHVQAAARGTVRVIVRLNSLFVPEGLLASPTHVLGQRQALRAAQSTVRQHLRGLRHRVAREFGGRLPMMAIEASPEALQMLASLRGVIAAVYEDVPVPLALAQSVPLINADKVWMAGYDGTGQIVAILDTGVQKRPRLLSRAARSSRRRASRRTRSARARCAPAAWRLRSRPARRCLAP